MWQLNGEHLLIIIGGGGVSRHVVSALARVMVGVQEGYIFFLGI